MGGEIFVTDPKPCRLTHLLERGEQMERVAVHAVSRFVVEDAGKAVDDGIDVGTDEQTPELVVVSRIGDHA